MSYSPYPISRNRAAADEVSAHCRQMFSSLPRSDQRRWAEIYVLGLLDVPGRKTVKRISSHIAGGGAEQCLQQFVNQSTWQSDVIRREVSMWLSQTLDPSFWILEDVVIPKNGRNSVGVDKQFVHPEGRAVNCQLGLGLFLSGDDWNCPVNWRLLLPASWEHDPERRSKAHVPPTQRHKSRWQHMLDVIDEASAEWAVPQRPVLGDLTAEPEVEPLLRGLEDRRLHYAVKVGVNRPAPVVAGRSTFGQLIEDAMRRDATAMNGWHSVRRRSNLIRVVAVPLAPTRQPARQRYLVAEWSTVSGVARSVWVTSFSPRDIQFLLEGIEQWSCLRAEMKVLYEDLGLRHFEGRSFTGWHHYATLVSVAAACRLLPRQYRQEMELASEKAG
jgi:SRSO17 transposase